MAREPAEVVFADGDLARWRLAIALFLGATGTLALTAFAVFMYVRDQGWGGTVESAAQAAPVLLALAFGAGLLVRAVLARDLDVDFASAVRARTPLLERAAGLLEGGRHEADARTANVTGRFGGLAVTVGAWVDPDRVPWDDDISCSVAFPCSSRAIVRRRAAHPGEAAAGRLRTSGPAPPQLDEALAATLLRGFDELHVRAVVLTPDGLTLRLPATARLLQPTRQRRLLAFATALARQLGAVPLQVSAVLREGEASCPYCRTPVAAGDRSDCDACGTPHHPECLSEHGGCTVLGCRGEPPRPEHERAR